MKSPCYKCENRKPACHDSCENYQTWKTEWAERRNSEERKAHMNFVDYRVNRNVHLAKAGKTRVRIGAT